MVAVVTGAAGTIFFLASPGGSCVHGAVLIVDGGMTA
jgi:NAD(P)-dependent dehydrogenase (short-subunit alcohol dehydrogenase family)